MKYDFQDASDIKEKFVEYLNNLYQLKYTYNFWLT